MVLDYTLLSLSDSKLVAQTQEFFLFLQKWGEEKKIGGLLSHSWATFLDERGFKMTHYRYAVCSHQEDTLVWTPSCCSVVVGTL